MYLELDIDNSSGFCNYLIEQMKDYIVNNIDDSKLILMDKYLNENNLILFRYGGKKWISSRNILISSVYNLRIRESRDKSVIEIDPNQIIPETEAKFIDIAKLINYGNAEIRGYKILDKMMNHFAKNIKQYYLDFIEEAL